MGRGSGTPGNLAPHTPGGGMPRSHSSCPQPLRPLPHGALSLCPPGVPWLSWGASEHAQTGGAPVAAWLLPHLHLHCIRAPSCLPPDPSQGTGPVFRDSLHCKTGRHASAATPSSTALVAFRTELACQANGDVSGDRSKTGPEPWLGQGGSQGCMGHNAHSVLRSVRFKQLCPTSLRPACLRGFWLLPGDFWGPCSV